MDPIVGDKISVLLLLGGLERAVVTGIDHVDKLVLFAVQDVAHNYGRASGEHGDALLANEGITWARGWEKDTRTALVAAWALRRAGSP